MATKVIRDYYKVLVLSQSGKGKTYSFINMDRNTTGYINGENKPLPFDAPFKYHARPKKFAAALKAFEDYVANPEIKVVILEGFNMILDMLLEEMKGMFKGFDVWSNYNSQVTRLINAIKNAQKEVVVTGHYEILNVEGDPEKRLKVHGKEHEGRVESHFTIVFYAEMKFKDDKPEYYFRTAGEGISAKCPPAIFGGAIKLPNDSKVIIDKIIEFAKKSEVTIEDKEAIFS